MENSEINKAVHENSPWLAGNSDWAKEDGSLRELKLAESEGLFSPPKMYYFLKKSFFTKIFEDSTSYGIIVIKGPRRIGKTSTLKLLIDDSIREGFPKESFLYLTLDDDSFFTEIDKKQKLKEILTKIINEYKQKDKPLILILDEVTFYKGWARVLKNLYDSGVIKEGVGIIATGSYSLDLSGAKRELSGRFGPLGEACGEELVFPPRRFAEIAETVLGNSNQFRISYAKNFGEWKKKMFILEYLAGFHTEEQNEKYGYSSKLNSVLEKYYQDLHQLFADTYIYAGGYPRKVYQSLISIRSGKTNIPDERYLSDIYQLIVSDVTKFRLSEEVIRQMLIKMEHPSFQIGGDLDFFCNLDKKIKLEECKKYLEYLSSSGLFEFIPAITNPSQMVLDKNLVNPTTAKLKFCLTDPAVFLAIYFGSRGMRKIFENSQTLFEKEPKVRELLYEAITIAHTAYINPIRNNDPKTLAFILDIENKSEEELSDVLGWYSDYRKRLIVVPIEVKTGKLNYVELNKKADKLKEKYSINKLVVVADTDKIEITEKLSIIPIEIFLLLI